MTAIGEPGGLTSANETHPGGSHSEGAGTTIAATREVRLAVVMYGGSSLAIYINGVAQELLHLVRATAPATPEPSERKPLRADDELRDTERVYRRLGQLTEDESVATRFPRFAGDEPDVDPFADPPAAIHTRFLVDIISGSSAGGINGIFLAKALATDRDLDGLKQLWVTEGDIGLLINDKASGKGLPGVEVEDPPTSLLNGNRMYYKLLQAFEGMDSPPPPMPPSADEEEPVFSSLVDDLDLYVTTTDLSGLVLPIELADKVIGEPRHRSVYHFVYATERSSGSYRNDFVPTFNPFLAFASRCTSSLPFVFQPMTLGSIDAIVHSFPRYQRDVKASGSDRWKRFISDYLYVDADGNETNDFASRSFGDGGSLDNKPFSHATERLSRRRADLPVDRKLLYVEPDPAAHVFGQPPEAPPDAITNLLQQLVLLPRAETIREDLQRVLDRNRQMERVRRVLDPLKQDVAALRRIAPEAGRRIDLDETHGAYLEDLIGRHSVAYGTYQRLRVAELTDDLTRLFCRLARLNEDSDEFTAIRYLVRAWRDRYHAHFLSDAPTSDGGAREAFSGLLLDADTTFEHRRLRHVIEETDILATPAGARAFSDTLPEASEGGVDVIIDEALTARGSVNDAAVAIRGIGRLLRSPTLPLGQSSTTSHPQSALGGNPAYAELVNRKVAEKVLSGFRTSFREAIEQGSMQGRPGEDVETTLARWTRSLHAALRRFLAGVRDDEARQRLANDVEDALDEDLRAVMAVVREEIRRGLVGARAAVQAALTEDGEDPVRSAVRRRLLDAYEDFAYQDVLAYPIRYGTDFGETDPIEIYRLSPKDATALVDPSVPPPRKKVAGAQFGHFGAFFDRLWRANDILWGRLDAAERLIEALVPPGQHRSENARIFKERAFGEILWTELTEVDKAELAGLMAAALAQLPVKDRSTRALMAFVEHQIDGPLEPRLRDVLIAAFERREDLVAYYRSSFDLDTRLKPGPTFRNAGRAAHVIGEVLGAIGKQKGAKLLVSPMAWLSRAGRLMTGLVEAATPGSTAHLLVRHWLVLAYLVDLVLIVGGGLLGQHAAQQFGWTMLWLTIAASVAVAAFADLLRGRTLWKAIGRVVVALVILGLIAMIALEVQHLGTDLAMRKGSLRSPPPGLPFATDVAARPWSYLGWTFVAVTVWGFALRLQGLLLRRPRMDLAHSAKGYFARGGLPPVVRGIVDFQLAGTEDRTKEILDAWGPSGRRDAKINLWLDLPFIVLYSIALYLGVTWAAFQWFNVWPFFVWLGWFLAYGQLLAGALDMVEDVCLLRILSRDEPGERLPSIAKFAALAKFLLVGCGAVYFLIGLIRSAPA